MDAPIGGRRRLFGRRGFTLIELMIVVAIIGILAMIAVPRFANLIRKAKEGATKGALGAVRSALTIYYADNEGRFPAGAAGSNSTFLQTSLTTAGKYLSVWPRVSTPNYHVETNTVDSISGGSPHVSDATDDGEWVYSSVETTSYWGSVWIECYHTDGRGQIWTTY